MNIPYCKAKIVRKLQSNRRGAVTVEFACTAGIAILFLFAMLEYGRVSMIRQSVELAVYEGGRKGSWLVRPVTRLWKRLDAYWLFRELSARRST